MTQNPMQQHQTELQRLKAYRAETSRMSDAFSRKFNGKWDKKSKAEWARIDARQKSQRAMQNRVHQLAQAALKWQGEQYEKERQERRDRAAQLLAQGKSTKEVAAEMGLSVSTIQKYRREARKAAEGQ